MKRKAQAALEFLTTYGWAFVLILAAIGAMIYYGLPNTERFISERCVISPEFTCVDYKLTYFSSTSAEILVKLTNSLNEEINITRTECVYGNGEKSDASQINEGANNWLPGESRTLNCTTTTHSGGFVTDDKSKIQFDVTYRKVNPPGFNHTISGEIVGRVTS